MADRILGKIITVDSLDVNDFDVVNNKVKIKTQNISGDVAEGVSTEVVNNLIDSKLQDSITNLSENNEVSSKIEELVKKAVAEVFNGLDTVTVELLDGNTYTMYSKKETE